MRNEEGDLYPPSYFGIDAQLILTFPKAKEFRAGADVGRCGFWVTAYGLFNIRI